VNRGSRKRLGLELLRRINAQHNLWNIAARPDASAVIRQLLVRLLLPVNIVGCSVGQADFDRARLAFTAQGPGYYYASVVSIALIVIKESPTQNSRRGLDCRCDDLTRIH